MKLKLSVLAIMIAFGSTSILAEAKGCVKGAVIGGVAGHLAGHHGVAGAAVGCAIGHHQATVKAKEQATQERASSGNVSASANAARPGDAVSNDAKGPSR